MMDCGRGAGFVRSLVLRKAKISIDPEHRAAVRPRIRDIVLAEFAQPRAYLADKGKHRLAHVGLVTFLVVLKPFAIVVAAKLLEELEEPRSEVTLGHRSPHIHRMTSPPRCFRQVRIQ